MPAREPLTLRVMETVEAQLRRRVSLRVLRAAYRVAYVLLRPWWYLTRPRTLGVKAVVRHEDAVLLVLHTYARRGLWDAPGGFLRPGEDPDRAVLRELAEELGVRPLRATSLGNGPHSADHKRETLYAYAVEVADDDVTPNRAEIAEARWFRHDELPPNVTRTARRLVARAYWPYWTELADEA
jgi:ADP-ribose pyrophosphatase YjhB (NUDIX family)